MPKIISKRATSGVGLVLELLGFILLFFFPIGTILGIAFLIYGFSKSKKYVCSECGNKIEDKGVKICPICKASFVIGI
jgi:hypothetical protein